MGLRRTMTTVYLDDRHYEYFKKHSDESMSYIIRKLLDKHIDNK